MMAQFFDDQIERDCIKPDKYGNFYLRMLYGDFVKMAGREPSPYFREVLKDFRYKVHKYGHELLITRVNT